MFHYHTDLAAAGATARASWAIFWATLLSGIGTVGAVITALFVPRYERHKAEKAETNRASQRVEHAQATCNDTRDLIDRIRWDLKGPPPLTMKQCGLWANQLEVQICLLRKFFDASSEPQLIRRISRHLQGSYEARDLLSPVSEKVYRHSGYDTQLTAALHGLKEVIGRLDAEVGATPKP